MKIQLSKLLFYFAFLALLFSCGTSHNVVYNGSMYEVKNSKIFKAGNDITEAVSEETKAGIEATLNARLETIAKEKAMKEALKAQQAEQEKVLKEAAKEQRALEKKQKEIEKAQKEREAARKSFMKASDQLKKEQNKYSKLLKRGKLSAEDIKKWDEKISALEKEKDKAESYYKSLTN